MKFNVILAVFILSILVSAQTATSNPNAADSQKTAASTSAKMECPCCKGMKDGDKAGACCSHAQAMKEGETMACCGGKDAKACMKGDQKPGASCGQGKCEGMKGCCGKDNDKDKNEQMAMACCKGNQCGQHDHAGMDK